MSEQKLGGDAARAVASIIGIVILVYPLWLYVRWMMSSGSRFLLGLLGLFLFFFVLWLSDQARTPAPPLPQHRERPVQSYSTPLQQGQRPQGGMTGYFEETVTDGRGNSWTTRRVVGEPGR